MTRVNYDRKMQEIIKSLDGKKSLAIHSCCGPCSSSVLEKLVEHFFVHIFYYNPNIDSKEEFEKRVESQERILENFPEVKLTVVPYKPLDFERETVGLENEPEGGKRCYNCHSFTLEETVKFAKEKGYDFFTSTLSVSPYKNHIWINEIGEKLEEKHGIRHLPNDFKKRDGYKRSVELSSEFGLFRQNYCGCKFSKTESEERKKE